MALNRFQGKIRYQPIDFELLPEKFTLSQIQHLYEVILEKELEKRNVRRILLSMVFLDETYEIQTDASHRAARLSRFNREKYQDLTIAGFIFEL
jgi:8-oxo-dGTP diphosphatase